MLRTFAPLLLLLILVGCNVSPTPTSVLSTPLVSTLRPTNTIQLAMVTPRPSATSTPLPTITALPTVTSTPVPALTADEIRTIVQKRLQDNGNCELPCWWGIVPGEAKLSGAIEFYRRALVSVDEVRRGDGTVYHTLSFLNSSANSEDYAFTVGLIEREGTIQAIEVRSDVDEAISTNRFPADWQRFSLDQILFQYGKPTHVELQVKPPLHPHSPPSYLMWIVYENHGFWILYAGRSSYDGTVMHICPSLKTTFGLDLWLQSTKSSTPVFQPEPDAGTRALEGATGMSLEEFYKTFKNADKKACLESGSTLPNE